MSFADKLKDPKTLKKALQLAQSLKKLDKNNDGKISGKDFAMMKRKKAMGGGSMKKRAKAMGGGMMKKRMKRGGKVGK